MQENYQVIKADIRFTRRWLLGLGIPLMIIGLIMFLCGFAEHAMLIIGTWPLIVGVVFCVVTAMAQSNVNKYAAGSSCILYKDRLEVKTLAFGEAAGVSKVVSIDEIAHVECGSYNTLQISLSNGELIKVFWVANSQEMIREIRELKKEAATSSTITVAKEIIKQTDPDVLFKYKKLLEEGIISEEEYEAKKKQILGL